MAIRNPNENESVKEYDELQTEEINKVADYVVESGSNTNGNWEKWASGKLIQWGKFTGLIEYKSAYGGGLYFYTITGKNFPIPFVGNMPNIDWGLVASTIVFINAGSTANSLLSLGQLRLVHSFNNSQQNGDVSWLAIGRWKL